VSGPADAVVVDLGAVGRASVALARWYRGLVATGEGDVAELGRARAELASLPPQPGRLGWAVRVIVCGGDDATDEEIVAAVSLLCDAASRAAGPSAPVAVHAAAVAPLRRRRGRVATVTQPTLPGMEPGGAA
jgi:hypothetical protein